MALSYEQKRAWLIFAIASAALLPVMIFIDTPRDSGRDGSIDSASSGEYISHGGVGYLVHSVDWAGSYADGKYLVVTLFVTNNGDVPGEAGPFEMLDDRGRRYATNFGSMALNPGQQEFIEVPFAADWFGDFWLVVDGDQRKVLDVSPKETFDEFSKRSRA